MWGISVAHGDDGFHPRFMNPPNLDSSKNAATNTMTYRVDTTPHSVEPEPYSLTADWLGFGHKGSASMRGYRVLCSFQIS